MSTSTPRTHASVDVAELTAKVKDLYAAVAEQPHERFHFKMGRGVAEDLGYPPEVLDRIPAGATESFAGVGYFFDLAGLQAGEQVLDLGSGSGMDAFFAALQVTDDGHVLGIDMTPEQLGKAERLRTEAGVTNVAFREGRIEHLPHADDSVDAVISNGVINLAPDKRAVFAEAARVLRPGGRLAIADMVTETALTESIVCNVDLWASCIGGAAQQDVYIETIADAGLRVEVVRGNDYYQFLSDQAQGASETFGVRSVSIQARKP